MGVGHLDGVQKQLDELARLLRRAQELFGDRPVTPPLDITPGRGERAADSAPGG